MKNVLIVGCGLSGAVLARELAEKNYSVTILDKKNHIAGNCYDFIDENGIKTHKYGPHIFHTNNKEVFDYLSRFTEWIDYKHKVKALLKDGRLVTLPVNQETKNIVGQENIIDLFYKPYTKKMWGLELDQIDPSVYNRIKIRDDLNDFYFPDDSFQYLPKEGYTKLVENLINHTNIKINLDFVFNSETNINEYFHVFNSMPIDEYFNYCLGKLEYRSIKFHDIYFPNNKIYPVATVNYTNNGAFTRITEWKNLPNHGVNPNLTKLTLEEPCDYTANNNERYYPVKDLSGKNKELYKKYKLLALNNSKMTFIGRLGSYVYIDMDQAVNMSLLLAKKF